MSHKVYVSNLSKETTNERFKEVFAAHGKVTDAIIMRDRDMTSRGFGFVDNSTEDEVTAVVAALNHTELDGKMIKVAKAASR